jgi:hypothetical protein
MPHPRFPRVFLSGSFDRADEPLFNWFREILEALEFQVFSGQDPSPHSLSDIVRERIGESNAFVGILSRRDKVDASNEWLPPSWVRDELAIARACHRSCAILAEVGVRVDGIIPLDSKYERFSREDLTGSASVIVRYFVSLRNEVSPPTETSEELATLRALGNELAGLSGWLGTVEQTFEQSGWSLAMVTARNTGRLFLIPPALREKVVEGYSAVQDVDAVLGEISSARTSLRSKEKGWSWSNPLPPLPEGDPLLARLHSAVELASAKVSTAWIALYRAGYPREWGEIQRRVSEMPLGPEREQVQSTLNAIFGD